MLFSRADMKGRPEVVKHEPKLRPRLSAAQPVTACSFRGAQAPLDSTQLPAAPPTAHRLRKLHPLASRGSTGSAQQEDSFHEESWVTESADTSDPKRRAVRTFPEREALLEAMHPGLWSPQRTYPFAPAQLEATASNPAEVV